MGWMMLGCCLVLWAPLARADPPPTMAPSSLSHVVPASAQIFIELQRPRQSDAQLRRADLWTLVQLLSGDRKPFDWRALVRRYLGLSPQMALNNLFGQRVALAAPSWKQLADCVVLVQLKRPELLATAVAPQRAVQVRKQNNVAVHRTATGLWVASNRRQAAFSLTGDPDSLFNGVVDLLAGGDAPALGQDRQFIEEMGRLGPGYLGCFCFSGRGEAEGALAQALQVFDRGVVGMYVRRDRLDFEMQATLHQPRQRVRRPTVDVERLERLPDSTLLAWAASADLPGAFRSVVEGDLAAEAAPYVAFARALIDAEALESEVITKVGPRFIVVWDRLRATSNAPQLAVLLESSDADGVVEALVEQLATVVSTLRSITAVGNPAATDAPQDPVEEHRHLETRILTVSLAGMLPDMGERSLTRALLSSVKPSFTTLGGWVVVATSPEQIRQLIDAYQGWIPTLGASEVLRGGRWRSAGEPVVLAAAQPAMASAIVASWERSDDAAAPWAYEQLFGQRPKPAERAPRQTLGIGIRRDPESGGVVVARVYAQGPASGKLQVDDRILGADGKLLSLEDPVGDLRKRIAECDDPGRFTLRVRRGQEVLDVLVPVQPLARPVSSTAADPASALRQLQSIGRGMSNAVYTVTQSTPDRFHACVSLQLVPLKPHRQRDTTRQRRPAAVKPTPRP